MKRLNAYRFTKRFVSEGIEFLTNRTVPERFQFQSRIMEFRNRYKGMEAKHDVLYFGQLQVVPRADIDSTLAKLYKGIGDIGRDRFYEMVKRKYIGISRRQLLKFLNNQELHQLVQQVKKQRVNKAIVASKPMERWQADLVDVSKYKSPQNSNTTFLLTVIDCFSKYAWVVPLKNKQASTVAKALEQVMATAGAEPATLQTDNGGEFEEEFEKTLARHGILHVHSRSYNPQANGQIERFNGTLKRMIYAHMLKYNTKTFIPHLQAMVATYNGLFHTGIKQTPTEAHTNKAVAAAVAKQIQKQALKSKKRGRHFKRAPLHSGDIVRIALIHHTLEKPVTFWTSELYQVMKVVEPAKEWDATIYVLHDGRKFTRDRLQKVDHAKLVRMLEAPAPKRVQKTGQKKAKEPLGPRARPEKQRERAPSSALRDSYVDM
jgi:transposase InsO family protein